MTWFEISIVVLLLAALGGLAATLWHERAREPVPLPISGGEPAAFELVHQRLDEVLTSLETIREDILRRPPGARPLGVVPPKPHRHQFMKASEERNNKVLRSIYVCRVDDCPDTYIDEEPEPALKGSN